MNKHKIQMNSKNEWLPKINKYTYKHKIQLNTKNEWLPKINESLSFDD